jgi:hypothetical protein
MEEIGNCGGVEEAVGHCQRCPFDLAHATSPP